MNTNELKSKSKSSKVNWSESKNLCISNTRSMIRWSKIIKARSRTSCSIVDCLMKLQWMASERLGLSTVLWFALLRFFCCWLVGRRMQVRLSAYRKEEYTTVRSREHVKIASRLEGSKIYWMIDWWMDAGIRRWWAVVGCRSIKSTVECRTVS
jgi:hypothetical protein